MNIIGKDSMPIGSFIWHQLVNGRSMILSFKKNDI